MPAGSRTTSLLPCPEHHIRFPGIAPSSNAKLGRNPFPFLELDIVTRHDMGKQGLNFIDCKETSGADRKEQRVSSRIISRRQRCLPCVSPESISQMFAGSGHRLIPARHFILIVVAKFPKAESVKFIGVWINFFICMSGTGWDGDKCACGNSHTIGKRERAQREAAHDN